MLVDYNEAPDKIRFFLMGVDTSPVLVKNFHADFQDEYNIPSQSSGIVELRQ